MKEIVQVEKLSFSYPGNDHQAISNLNFTINEGEIFGFLGPSGAGKTTTQKVLIHLLSGYTGSVFFGGRDLKTWGSEFYNHIGVGFELPNHYPRLTALENLSFFASFYDNKPGDFMPYLEMVGLADSANKRISQFSKGMKMRLNFIRSFMHEPEFLFYDEPTAGLDPVNARNVKEIIRSQKNRGKTIFLTTHNMHDADELCDRVGFIVNGELKIIDNPQRLKQENGKRWVEVGYIESANDETFTVMKFELEELGSNNDFIQLLKAKEIRTLHSGEASLEDIFILVTGEKLQ